MQDSSDLQQLFGQRMRELRRAKDLFQGDIAAECGLDGTYISGIERGKRNVSLQNILFLAQTLDVSIPELMTGIDTGACNG